MTDASTTGCARCCTARPPHELDEVADELVCADTAACKAAAPPLLPDPVTADEPCHHRCGYVASGRDLLEHELHEHRPCPDCGAGKGQDLEIYALTHGLACPRLRPGYEYPAA